jgi:hypothetical protein
MTSQIGTTFRTCRGATSLGRGGQIGSTFPSAHPETGTSFRTEGHSRSEAHSYLSFPRPETGALQTGTWCVPDRSHVPPKSYRRLSKEERARPSLGDELPESSEPNARIDLYELGDVGAITGNDATNPTALGRYVQRLPKKYASLTARPTCRFTIPRGGTGECLKPDTLLAITPAPEATQFLEYLKESGHTRLLARQHECHATGARPVARRTIARACSDRASQTRPKASSTTDGEPFAKDFVRVSHRGAARHVRMVRRGPGPLVVIEFATRGAGIRRNARRTRPVQLDGPTPARARNRARVAYRAGNQASAKGGTMARTANRARLTKPAASERDRDTRPFAPADVIRAALRAGADAAMAQLLDPRRPRSATPARLPLPEPHTWASLRQSFHTLPAKARATVALALLLESADRESADHELVGGV